MKSKIKVCVCLMLIILSMLMLNYTISAAIIEDGVARRVTICPQCFGTLGLINKVQKIDGGNHYTAGYACDSCSYTTRSIMPHNSSTLVSTTADTHTYKCTCGNINAPEKHKFDETQTCTVCKYKYNGGKDIIVNGESYPYNTHVFDGTGSCKICGAAMTPTTNGFVSAMRVWDNEIYFDDNNITFNGYSVSVSINGVIENFSSSMAGVSLYNTYYPTSDYSKYENGRCKLGNCDQRSAGTISVTGNGSNITFTGFHTTGGPYVVDYYVGSKEEARRYTTPSPTSTPTPSAPSKYYITVQHINDTDNDVFFSDPEPRNVEPGDDFEVTRLYGDDLKSSGRNDLIYDYVIVIQGGEETVYKTEEVKLEDINGDAQIIFHYHYNGKMAKIKIEGRISNYPYNLLYSLAPEEVMIKTNKYDKKCTRLDLDGLTYSNYIITYGSIVNIDDISMTDKYNGQAVVSVGGTEADREKDPSKGVLNETTSEIIITYFYNPSPTGLNIQIRHIDEGTMEPLKSTQYDLSDLVMQCLRMDKENGIDKFREIIASGKDASYIVTECFKLIKENGIDLAALRSLNLRSDEYSKYVNSGVKTFDVDISSTYNYKDRYVIDFDKIKEVISSIQDLQKAISKLSNKTITIDFYYKEVNLHVKHILINPDGTEKILLEEDIPFNGGDITVVPSGDYHYIDSQLDDNPRSNSNPIIVREDGNSHELIIYYRDAVYLHVKDTWIDEKGNSDTIDRKDNIEIKEDTTNVTSANLTDGYYNVKLKVNDITISEAFKDKFSTYTYGVNTKEKSKDVYVEFVYEKFEKTPPKGDRKIDPPTPGPDPKLTPPENGELEPVVCYPSILDVNNNRVLNNQFVIGSEIKLVIPQNGVHEQLVDYGDVAWNDTYAFMKTVVFPFDVYYEGKYYNAGNEIILTYSNADRQTDFTFLIPVWVEEGTYTIKAYVSSWESEYGLSEFQDTNGNEKWNNLNDELNIIAWNTIEITLTGKLYEFTVTDLSSDTSWTNSLFSEAKISSNNADYVTAKLPIGQGIEEQKPVKYPYGIALGSKFKFRVATVGAKNNGIRIEPKVYFAAVNNNGTLKSVSDVTNSMRVTYLKKNTDGIGNCDFTFTSKLKDYAITNGKTRANINAEILRAKALNTKLNVDNLVPLGKLGGLTIQALKTPYLESEYLSADKLALYKKNGREADALNAVSHWYGEYGLPVTTKNPNGDKGYYIVCFEVRSLKQEGAAQVDYFKYENQIVGNQWENENNKLLTIEIQLPNGTKCSITPKIADNHYFYPVAIYDSTKTVANDFMSEGTH